MFVVLLIVLSVPSQVEAAEPMRAQGDADNVSIIIGASPTNQVQTAINVVMQPEMSDANDIETGLIESDLQTAMTMIGMTMIGESKPVFLWEPAKLLAMQIIVGDIQIMGRVQLALISTVQRIQTAITMYRRPVQVALICEIQRV